MNKTIELLVTFVNQRPNLDANDYVDARSYRSESRGITKDRAVFHELLNLAYRRINNLENKLTEKLESTNGRLSLENGKLQYITGQYFPTEYRPAACRAIADLIWNDYAEEKNEDGTETYKDGHQIRKAIKRNLSRAASRYFN